MTRNLPGHLLLRDDIRKHDFTLGSHSLLWRTRNCNFAPAFAKMIIAERLGKARPSSKDYRQALGKP